MSLCQPSGGRSSRAYSALQVPGVPCGRGAPDTPKGRRDRTTGLDPDRLLPGTRQGRRQPSELSTIAFSNRESISGIQNVSFSSVLSLDALNVITLDLPEPFYVPVLVFATFSEGSFSITDNNNGSVELLSGSYTEEGLSLVASDSTGFVIGDVSASLAQLGGEQSSWPPSRITGPWMPT